MTQDAASAALRLAAALRAYDIAAGQSDVATEAHRTAAVWRARFYADAAIQGRADALDAWNDVLAAAADVASHVKILTLQRKLGRR